MARRMLNSEMFSDEVFIQLDDITRLIWVGLIVGVADDQGRLLDNPVIIKAKIFPADTKSTQRIQKSLKILENHGLIYRYTKNKKNIIQIVNWWKHQTPSWASPSTFEAPDGWVDREKYNAGDKKVTMNGWDTCGGFIGIPTDKPIGIPNGIPTDEPIDVPVETPDEIVKLRKDKLRQDKSAAAVFQAYESEIGVISPHIADEIKDLLADTPSEWFVRAFEESAKQNKRSWSYAKAILKRWKVEGFDNGNKKSKQPKYEMGYRMINGELTQTWTDENGVEYLEDPAKAVVNV